MTSLLRSSYLEKAFCVFVQDFLDRQACLKILTEPKAGLTLQDPNLRLRGYYYDRRWLAAFVDCVLHYSRIFPVGLRVAKEAYW